MKMIAVFLISILFLSCNTDPQPLQYGKDACYTCKMTLIDKKFGAEIVTAKGKVYKFDDMNCMVNFINSGYLEDETLEHILVVDYTQPGKLIPAEKAFYLKSDEIRSPMASGVAAFESEKIMLIQKSKLKAMYMDWGELNKQFK